ncbi:pyridoxal 5'-phosphate synthase glutaminase subunit PdxT, partial [Streptomyces sp. PH10-H1]|nr:pyridoxal 5'-phosphate synthase glutaminase subunit PdxT [Streptomyces sp. PH10-H1]
MSPSGAAASPSGSTAAPVIGVLALQGDVREHLAALTAAGAQAVPGG